MKKLGLIGGTGPESTLIYYKEITGRVCQKMGSHTFPPLTIESMSVFKVLPLAIAHDDDGLTQYLLGGIRNLAAAGADFAALTGITPHVVFERLEKASPIPLVSMVETTAAYLTAHHLEKVLLLGTLPTMEGTFVKRPLEAKDIHVTVPSAEEQALINHKIETELEYGNVTDSFCGELKNICERCRAVRGVEAIILGCTELPLAFARISLSIPTIDVMEIHIDALVEQIVGSAICEADNK
ncbi:MAG: aspartate/glutamate racemase family protein [Succiniclasticum sp.]|jgi:aspartate racemase